MPKSDAQTQDSRQAAAKLLPPCYHQHSDPNKPQSRPCPPPISPPITANHLQSAHQSRPITSNQPTNHQSAGGRATSRPGASCPAHCMYVVVPPLPCPALWKDEGVCRVRGCSLDLFPQGRTVSGDEQAIEWLVKNAQSKGAKKATRIKTSGAFHTKAMAGAQAALVQQLRSIDIKMPRMALYSNVTGKPYASVDEMRQLLERQVVEPVAWETSMLSMIATGVTRVVETGPGQQLKAMLKRTDPATHAVCEVLK